MRSVPTARCRSRLAAGSSNASSSACGIIREKGPGLYWLDVVAYDIDLRQRFNRVRILLLVLVVALAVGLGVSVAVAK